MSMRVALRVVRDQLRSHIDLYPLFVALGTAGAMSVGIMCYTSANKADVSWNRWTNPDPFSRINWEKHEQKLLMGVPSEKELYKKDDQVISLRQKIYGSGEYYKKDEHH